MKNYLETYAPKVTKHQEGGDINAGQDAPQGGGGIQDMLAQVIQAQDPNMALEFCNMLGQQMGIGAPAQPGATPMGKYGMEVKAPIFRKGGTL